MKLKNYWRFLAVFLFLLVSLLILEQTKTLVRKDNWPVMLNASRRMEVAMAAVREEKLNRGYKISPIDDPNPVSYTHLDVYKRQSISSVLIIFVIA